MEMKLKQLIIVRHGDHEFGNLSELGKKQIQDTTEKILAHLVPGKILLFSSYELRAKQSAEIIKSLINSSLGLDVTYETYVWLGPSDGYRKHAVLNHVNVHIDESEVIIFVTHLECAEFFPTYFAKEVFNNDTIPIQPVKMGDAIIFDCENVKVIKL